MANRLYTKRGGLPGAAMDLITNTAPAFDHNTPLIELGASCQNGAASQGTFVVEDPFDRYLTPTGFWAPAHTLVRWTEDAPGSELWLSSGRVSGGEIGRGNMHADDWVEHTTTVDDANVEVRGLAFTEDWVRGAETGVDRLYALQAYILNGTSSTSPTYRPSTTIVIDDSHLTPNAGTTTMQAKTYPAGTQPQEVIDDAATTEGKIWGVVIHHVGEFSPAVLDLVPAAYWRLGEPSGTTAVNEMGTNDGTYVNTPTLGVTGAVDGDTAITLNGTNEYVSVADNAALDLGDVFTLSAWINMAGSSYRGIMSKGAGAYYLRLNADDTISLLSDVTAMIATTTDTVPSGWHHIVATKNVTAVHLYIDGVDSADTTTTAVVTGNTATALNIGRDVGSATEYFAGSLDEVALWNRALTPTEVESLYRVGAGTPQAGDPMSSHLCLFYTFEANHSLWLSPATISDDNTLIDSTNLTAPVWAPIWDHGSGTVANGQSSISGLVSHYTTTDFLYVNFSWAEEQVETWIDGFTDADAADATEAGVRATAILTYRNPGDFTYRFSVLVLPEQVGLICAGMSITIDTAVIIGGPLRGFANTIRIAQLTWQPAADGLYWAHMLLGRGYRSMPPSRGKFKKDLPEGGGG